MNVAEFLRQRLFGADTSVIMTSATLGVQSDESRVAAAPLQYFARQVGGEKATLVQAGSPFDYERQMKIHLVSKMPDPRDATYRSSLVKWIEHFVRMTNGSAFVLFTNFKLMLEIGEEMEPFFDELGIECIVQGTGNPAPR